MQSLYQRLYCAAPCPYYYCCGVASSASKPLQLPARVEPNMANDNRPAARQRRRRRVVECGKADETSHARRASPECQQNGVQVASSLPQRSTAGRQACLAGPSSSTTTCRGIPPVVGSAFAHNQFLQVDMRSNPRGKSILRLRPAGSVPSPWYR
jgi:hypothetical protein